MHIWMRLMRESVGKFFGTHNSLRPNLLATFEHPTANNRAGQQQPCYPADDRCTRAWARAAREPPSTLRPVQSEPHMNTSRLPLIARALCAGVAASASLLLVSCYKELPSDPDGQAHRTPEPQPQQHAENSAPAANTGLGSQTGSSTLGKAKQSASNIVRQAEEQSQRTADENP
jgi:hypothetical protein